MVGRRERPGPRQLEGEARHGGAGGRGDGGGDGVHLSVLLEVVVLHHSRALGERGQVVQVVVAKTLRAGKFHCKIVIKSSHVHHYHHHHHDDHHHHHHDDHHHHLPLAIRPVEIVEVVLVESCRLVDVEKPL